MVTSGAGWSPWILEKSTRYEISDTPIEEPQHRKPLISGVRYELAPLVGIVIEFQHSNIKPEERISREEFYKEMGGGSNGLIELPCEGGSPGQTVMNRSRIHISSTTFTYHQEMVWVVDGTRGELDESYSLLVPRQEHSQATQAIDAYVILRGMQWHFLE
jgi:hypothetical protein